MFKEKIIPVFIPFLGCPHRCVFCNQKTITGIRKTVNIQKLEIYLRDAVSTLADDLDRVEIAFYGGSFSCLPVDLKVSLLELANKYVKQYAFWGIRLSTRPDCLQEEEVFFLKERGVKTVEIGAQSLSDEVLLQSKRGHTANDVYEASRRVKEVGLELGIQIMVGLPGDNRERFFSTVRRISSDIKPSFVRIYPCLVIEGSELADMYKRGEYLPISLDEAVELSALAYKEFYKAGIKVIRMGLQDIPTMRWNREILTGPYHPSFGELVKSEVFYKDIIDALSRQSKGKEIFIRFNPRDESILRGQKNKNILRLKRLYPAMKINLTRDGSLERGKFLISK